MACVKFHCWVWVSWLRLVHPQPTAAQPTPSPACCLHLCSAVRNYNFNTQFPFSTNYGSGKMICKCLRMSHGCALRA